MTVCIAATCDAGKAIVFCSDRLISSDTLKSELAVPKIRSVLDNWWALPAGNEPTVIFNTIDSMNRMFEAEREERPDYRPDLVDVQAALEIAYRSQRDHKAEGMHLAALGLTLNEFMGSRASLGDRLFEQVLNGVNQVRLDALVLVAGFEPVGRAALLGIDQLNLVGVRHDWPGFAAVGSGAQHALLLLPLWRADIGQLVGENGLSSP